MVVILSILAALGLAVGAAWVLGSPKQQPDRAAEAAWSQLAETLDLDYDPGGLLRGPIISGTLNDMQVQLDTLHQLRDGRKVLFTRFVLRNENLPEGLDKKSKAKPSDDQVKRVLAQVTRRHVTELIKRIGATLSGKKVRWVRESSVWPPDHMADIIRRIVEICDFLCLPESETAKRLLAGVNDESLPDGHRKQMKQLLFERYQGSEECDSLASEMLEEGDPQSRLAAARALGAGGLEALAKIARTSDIPKDIREQALGTIISKHEPSVAYPHLASVVKSPNAESSRTALGVIRRQKYLPAMRLLLETAKDPSTPSDKICNIIDIVGEIGDASAQQTMLTLLQHEFLMVRRRAATALGRIGTQSALGQLQRYANSSSENKRLRDLCTRAIERIRKRSQLRGDEPTAEAV